MSKTNYFYIMGWNYPVSSLFTLGMLISTIVGSIMDLCPWWLNILSGFGICGLSWLVLQKRKLMIYWSTVRTRSKDDAIEIIWPQLYKPTIFYERFIRWYKEDKPIFVIMIIMLFAAGGVIAACGNNDLAGWYYLGLLGAMLLLIVPLGLDKLRTIKSVSTIRYILHMRGWNFHSNHELMRYAEKLDIDTKYFR